MPGGARAAAGVLTLGGGAALLRGRADHAEHFPAVQVEAVDPTGAGDAFIGGLAVFLAEGQTLREAVRRQTPWRRCRSRASAPRRLCHALRGRGVSQGAMSP